MEGFNNKNLYLTVLEAGKSKIEVPADWLPGEGSLLCLQTAAFSLHAHMAHPLCSHGERLQLPGFPFVGMLTLSDQGPTLVTSFNLFTSVKASSPNSAHWG